MEGFILILTIAVLIEALVEYGKTIYRTFAEGDTKTGITQAITIVVGVCFAFLFNLCLFKTMGIEVSAVADKILTGIIISRGSNYASDLIKRLTSGNNYDYVLTDEETETEEETN